MKYDEITEYQKIANTTLDKFPDISQLTHLQNFIFSSKLGSHNLYVKETSNEIFFGVEYEQKIIAGLILNKKLNKKYNLASEAYTSVPDKNIIVNLMAYLKSKGFQFISDTQLTDSGEALWDKLISLNMVKIINIETDKRYELADAPLYPKDDNKNSSIFSKKNPNGQKWFFIVEGNIKLAETLIKENDNKIRFTSTQFL